MGCSVKVLDGFAAPSEESRRFKEKLETKFEDAGIFRDEKHGELGFVFTEGVVVFHERTVEGENVDELIKSIVDLEEVDAKDVFKRYKGTITGDHFSFRVIIGDSVLMDAVDNKEQIAKLLFQETGTLGAAEMGMLSNAVLDFGENKWVISPVGVLLTGEFEDATRCIYLIAQSMVGVASYMSITETLVKRLYEAPPTFTEKELSTYESELERVSDTTNYVINDVRDEMLNADPRTVLIVKKLHEAMSIEPHEQQVKLFLDVARRKVDRARAIKMSREQKRFSAILFSFSVIIGISNIIVIFVNLTKSLNIHPLVAIVIEAPILVVTVLLVIYLFQEIFKRTLKF